MRDVNRRTARGIVEKIVMVLIPMLAGCGGPELPPSHAVRLEGDYSQARSAEIDSFEAYLEMEEALFTELDRNRPWCDTAGAALPIRGRGNPTGIAVSS